MNASSVKMVALCAAARDHLGSLLVRQTAISTAFEALGPPHDQKKNTGPRCMLIKTCYHLVPRLFIKAALASEGPAVYGHLLHTPMPIGTLASGFGVLLGKVYREGREALESSRLADTAGLIPYMRRKGII